MSLKLKEKNNDNRIYAAFFNSSMHLQLYFIIVSLSKKYSVNCFIVDSRSCNATGNSVFNSNHSNFMFICVGTVWSNKASSLKLYSYYDAFVAIYFMLQLPLGLVLIFMECILSKDLGNMKMWEKFSIVNATLKWRETIVESHSLEWNCFLLSISDGWEI